MMAVTPVTPSSTDATHSGDLHLTRGTNIHSLAWAIKLFESCHLPQILSDFKTSNAKFQPSQYCGEDVPRKLIILKHLLPFDNVYLVAHPFYKLFSKYRRVMRQRNRRETLRNFTTSHNAVREKLHNVTTPHSTKVSPHFPKHQSRSSQQNRKNLTYFTHTTTVSLQDRDVVFRRVERCVGQYLASHPCLAYAHQEVLRPRKKRSSLEFEDPLYNEQWHLSNPVPGQYDINVGGVWESGITGRGVTVCVIDDGLEWRHPDLRKNYSPAGSYDLNSDDPDPSPVKNGERNEHGTRCAGEIAAVANSVCGVGVAFHANISGIRVLGERMTDSMEAAAFVQGLAVNDIYSCSWGPDDDGRTVDGPHHLAREALKHGVTYGRDGYGAIYVVASGNGGRNKDNCNFDGYANSVYTVTIGAVDSHGRMPYYAEECAAMLAVTPSSGTKGRDIVTTDWQEISASGCTKHHSGTSAAAPLAAAVIALALEVQPCLSWRDVQHLIALTSRKIDANNPDWSSNGAGLHHSHQHGFGLMDAAAMVSSAAVWESVPFSTTYSTPLMVEDLAIPAERMQGVTVRCEVDQSTLGSYALATLEFVQVQVSLQHQYRGSLKIVLVCPSGTRSTLAAPREADNSSKGLNEWSLGTVRCWGEAAAGVYQVTVTQTRHQHLSGRLTSWRLVLHGSSLTTHQFQDRRRLVERVQRGEVIHVNRSTLCHPPELRFKPFHPLPDKWLKVLAVTSLFLLMMVAFNTLEYIFCYNDEKERFYRRLRDVAAGRALQHRRNTSGSLVGRLGPPGDSAAYGSVVGGVEGDTIGQCASQSPASYEILPLMSEGAREAALVSPSPSCDADVSSFGADEDDSDEDGLSSHCTSDTVLPKDTDATDFTNDEFFSEVDEERLVSGVSGGGLLLGGKVDKVEVQEEEEDEEEEVFVRDSIMGGGVMGRRDVVHVDLWAER